MATRKQKVSFAIKRFRGFWHQFSRSKRGLVGLTIIILFSVAALGAPLLASNQPIDPQMGVGDYPILGPVRGIRIASELAKPDWYKYLPWMARGPTELTERFYSEVVIYFNQPFQSFRNEGEINATDANILLGHRVASIQSVKETNSSGTFTLSQPTQWDVDPQAPREIIIKDIYENNTLFEVDYTTGVDLVDNSQLSNDIPFDNPQTLSEWTLTSNYPDLVSVSYSNSGGFVFRSTDNHGAVLISYTPGMTPPSGPVEINFAKSFNYPYYEPPKSFYIHTSIKIEGLTGTDISYKIFFMKEDQSFMAINRTQAATNTYQHLAFVSSEPKIAENVGTSPPQDRIFASPGNYKFVIQLTLPAETAERKIYLDNVNLVLYGNIYGIMGTDNGRPFPRDLWSLLIYGARVSLLVGVLAALFSTLIGLFLGLVSGYMGGFMDEGIMRFADLLLVLPTLPLFIVLIVALKQVAGYVSMWNIIIILTLFGWMSFARSVRSMVLSIRERAFIEAARASGAGKLHIINRHIIPNVFALVYITLATSVPGAIITEASLSWLGLGDPMLPSWGKILYDFNSSSIALAKGMTEYWFWIFPACIAIALLATAFILVGYALDEILNPRLRERR